MKIIYIVIVCILVTIKQLTIQGKLHLLNGGLLVICFMGI